MGRAATATAAAEEDYVPSHPAAALLAHCLQKASQVGAVAGVVLVTAAAARGRLRGTPLAPERGARLMAASFAAGTGGLGAACAAKIATIDEDGCAERAYRIHYNEGQQRTDRLANAGGLLLGGVVAVALPAATLQVQGINALAGFAAGTAAGVAAHVATRARGEDAASQAPTAPPAAAK